MGHPLYWKNDRLRWLRAGRCIGSWNLALLGWEGLLLGALWRLINPRSAFTTLCTSSNYFHVGGFSNFLELLPSCAPGHLHLNEGLIWKLKQYVCTTVGTIRPLEHPRAMSLNLLKKTLAGSSFLCFVSSRVGTTTSKSSSNNHAKRRLSRSVLNGSQLEPHEHVEGQTFETGDKESRREYVIGGNVPLYDLKLWMC